MGMSKPWPPKARKLRTAPSGPLRTSAQRGSEAPTSSMMRSNGPKLSPISRNPCHFPGVGAVIDGVIYAGESEGCPQRFKTTEEAAPGEVAGWPRAYRQRSELCVLHPVEFCVAVRVDAETFQDGAYAPAW
jgi:hypothetical protein